MSTATMIVQALALAREAIDALRENAHASRELAAELRRRVIVEPDRAGRRDG